ncbi:MAG: hypothetical protein ABI791_13220 [Acidobacteriota bacterium]
MKEAVFILLVVAVLFALTAFRYRKQIQTVLGVWRMLSTGRSNAGGRQVQGEQKGSSGKLVNCAKCGTWVPEQRAIRVPPNIYYCSRECVEQFVKAG